MQLLIPVLVVSLCILRLSFETTSSFFSEQINVTNQQITTGSWSGSNEGSSSASPSASQEDGFTDVKAGDVVAVMGNTGFPSCATGVQLHFEVHKNGILVNAEDYLENKTLPYLGEASQSAISIGSGSWPWPVKSPIITQRFGHTPHYYYYAGGVHTGIDMISNESYLIYASADGRMIKKSGLCGFSTYNYILIQHADGVESLYLNVQ